MVEACKEEMEQAKWSSMAELETNLAIVAQYLDYRDQGAGSLPQLEPKARKGLRQCLTSLSKETTRLRSKIRPMESTLRELKEKSLLLEQQKLNAVRSMAAIHLQRVGAPAEVVRAAGSGGKAAAGEDELLAACTLGAPADTFNSLYAALVAKQPPDALLPEWECSDEDALRPEKDLLGMCPGGKPHLTAQQLSARGEKRCFCIYCIPAMRLLEVQAEIAQIKKQLLKLRPELAGLEVMQRETARAVRRLSGEVQEEEKSDPVFYDEKFEPSDEASALAHRTAEQQWEQVASTLSLADLPLRVVFLDKSASMGNDVVCYEALHLGLHRSLYPTRGSTLTFLFAAPGQTEVVFRRPSDPPVRRNIDLGCATWFNEPILRTLRFLAPAIEKLNFQEWMAKIGEPPLQVMCLTDGQDNCSPEQVRTMSGMLSELKEIKGPASGKKLFVPVTGRFKCPQDTSKVPVWLAWICCGMGGQELLEANTCKEICLIDAVSQPQFREQPEALPPPGDAEPGSGSTASEEAEEGELQRSTAASRARQRVASACLSSTQLQQLDDGPNSIRWSVGHRVRVRSSAPGQAPKAGVVLRVIEASEDDPPRYELLLDDEGAAIVEAAQLLGAPAAPALLLATGRGGRRQGAKPQQGFLARTAEPHQQRLQVLAVVDSALQDLGGIMKVYNPKIGHVSLEEATAAIAGGEEIQGGAAEALEAVLEEAQSGTEVFSVPSTSPCALNEVLLDALQATGRVAWRLIPEDRTVALRLLCAGLETLLAGGRLAQAHLAEQVGVFAGVMDAYASRRLKTEDRDLEAWQDMLARPLQDLLKALSRHGLLDKSQSTIGESVTAPEEARACLMALRRLFDPSAARGGMEDALRRAVNRFQRLQPRFSFCSQPAASEEPRSPGGTAEDAAEPPESSDADAASVEEAPAASSAEPRASTSSRPPTVHRRAQQPQRPRCNSTSSLRLAAGAASRRSGASSRPGSPAGSLRDSVGGGSPSQRRGSKALPVLGAVLPGSPSRTGRSAISPASSSSSPWSGNSYIRSSSVTLLPSIESPPAAPAASSLGLMATGRGVAERTPLLGVGSPQQRRSMLVRRYTAEV